MKKTASTRTRTTASIRKSLKKAGGKVTVAKTNRASPLARKRDLIGNAVGYRGDRARNRSATSSVP
jgi:hypothetical protein